ncbi:hypothetical protein AB5I41_25585 [Sphingomonas sp. MMS24-JH45]
MNGGDAAANVFKAWFAMLKPGGTLGVVDHRLPESADAAKEKDSGYVKESTVRRLAEAAGFRFAGASPVNANPKDGHDHPKASGRCRRPTASATSTARSTPRSARATASR